MFEKFSRSWGLIKASASVLRADKELMLFPILSSLATLLVLATFALPVFALNDWLHALEDAHGRDRSGPRFGDRPLDIDIVFFDDLVLSGPGHLQLPRDELKHAFVLRPLAEIAPDFVDPRSGRTLAALWADSAERDVACVPAFDPVSSGMA